MIDTNAYLQQHVENISSNNEELKQKLLALKKQLNTMNLFQNPAIPPGQKKRPHTTGKPPQYPQYPQPPPQGYKPPPMKNASPPQFTYRQPYAQRCGYRGRGRGRYLPRGAAQGRYQQQGHYGGPTQQYEGRILKTYQAPSHQYGQNSN